MSEISVLIESMDLFLEAASRGATTKKEYIEEVRKKVKRMIGRNYNFKAGVDKNGWLVAAPEEAIGTLSLNLAKTPGEGKKEGYSKEYADWVYRFKPKGFDEKWASLT